MCIINGALDPTEKNKIENMFAGDSNRDASPKIRGFLFQDLVAVDKLLAVQTVSVYLECLEDVDVLCDNNGLEIIQVKYLPGSGPQKKGIMTDLYYQFLRTEVLGLSLNPKPQLLVHTNEKVTIPDLNKMKAYINCTRENRPQQIENTEEWLSEVIYKLKTKEEQKNAFVQMASKASIF